MQKVRDQLQKKIEVLFKGKQVKTKKKRFKKEMICSELHT